MDKTVAGLAVTLVDYRSESAIGPELAALLPAASNAMPNAQRPPLARWPRAADGTRDFQVGQWSAFMICRL